MEKLPPLFHVNNKYEYFRSSVKYIGRNNEYYKFYTSKGALLLIDKNNAHLIFGQRIRN